MRNAVLKELGPKTLNWIVAQSSHNCDQWIMCMNRCSQQTTYADYNVFLSLVKDPVIRRGSHIKAPAALADCLLFLCGLAFIWLAIS
jgi:hypothetical protein